MSHLTVEGFIEYLNTRLVNIFNNKKEFIIRTCDEMKGMWNNIPVERFVIEAQTAEEAIILLDKYLNKNYQTSNIERLIDIFNDCGEEDDTYDEVVGFFMEDDTLWMESKEGRKIRNMILIK